MKIKVPLKEHIVSRLWRYIIVLLLTPVVCTAIITLKNNPRAEERFNLFVQGSLMQDSSFYSDVKNIIKEDKIFNLYCYSSGNEQFESAYNNLATSIDLFVLSKDVVDKKGVGVFTAIPSNNIFYSDTNYIFKDYHFGILIPSKQKESLSQKIMFDTGDYYCFVNYTSVHSISFVDSGKTDQCLKVIKYLTGYEEK